METLKFSDRLVVVTGAGRGIGRGPAYSLVKGAILSLMRSLALLGEKAGIRVNAIAPSAYTRMVEYSVADSGLRSAIQRISPAYLVAPGAALLVHDACPTNGETPPYSMKSQHRCGRSAKPDALVLVAGGRKIMVRVAAPP